MLDYKKQWYVIRVKGSSIETIHIQYWNSSYSEFLTHKRAQKVQSSMCQPVLIMLFSSLSNSCDRLKNVSFHSWLGGINFKKDKMHRKQKWYCISGENFDWNWLLCLLVDSHQVTKSPRTKGLRYFLIKNIYFK